MGTDPVQEITESLRWRRDGVPPPEGGSPLTRTAETATSRDRRAPSTTRSSRPGAR